MIRTLLPNVFNHMLSCNDVTGLCITVAAIMPIDKARTANSGLPSFWIVDAHEDDKL